VSLFWLAHNGLERWP